MEILIIIDEFSFHLKGTIFALEYGLWALLLEVHSEGPDTGELVVELAVVVGAPEGEAAARVEQVLG